LCVPVADDPHHRRLRSAARGDLVVPRAHRERYGRRGFYYSGPELWNYLPLDVRQKEANLPAFKRQAWPFERSDRSLSLITRLGGLTQSDFSLAWLPIVSSNHTDFSQPPNVV